MEKKISNVEKYLTEKSKKYLYETIDDLDIDTSTSTGDDELPPKKEYQAHKVVIEFTTDNDAFVEWEAGEVDSVLKRLGKFFQHSTVGHHGKLYDLKDTNVLDTNGNVIGKVIVTEI